MFSLFKKKEEVSFKELVKQGAIILDVRSVAEFNSGHVRGAINIPLDTIPSKLTKIDKNKIIITCCMSGGRSSVAKNILHGAGYDSVYDGGGWRTLQSEL
jgi:rhodanese-related sulfurtransferase